MLSLLLKLRVFTPWFCMSFISSLFSKELYLKAISIFFSPPGVKLLVKEICLSTKY